MKKEQRFVTVFQEGTYLGEDGVRKIIVDRITGVHYFAWKVGEGAGITPLLDSDGKVIVSGSQYMFDPQKLRIEYPRFYRLKARYP